MTLFADIKKILTVTAGSVKTITGVAKASVKEVDGSGVSTPPSSQDRWLEVRLQFDQYSQQNSDATIIELRSGIVGSLSGPPTQPGPDQTTAVPIAPIHAGSYPYYVSYAALAKTTSWPDTGITGGLTILTASLANAIWAELPAGSVQNESVMTAAGMLDVIIFFGPLPPGTGYSLAMKETAATMAYTGDPNVTVHVRVWDTDPTVTAWATGSPPSDGAVPSNVVYPGTAPYNTVAPPYGSLWPPFPGLDGNASGPVTNGWSLWALNCAYGAGSSFTHNGAAIVGGGDARVYHADGMQLGITHPGVNGTFEVL